MNKADRWNRPHRRRRRRAANTAIAALLAAYAASKQGSHCWTWADALTMIGLGLALWLNR